MAEPVRCPTCGSPVPVAPDGSGRPGPCPNCRLATPKRLRVPPGRPLVRLPPAESPRPCPWPVVRLAAGIGAAFGALVVLGRWAAGQAPPPADDWAYQCGRALGGAFFNGLVGLNTSRQRRT
jgi:hypothetical protein